MFLKEGEFKTAKKLIRISYACSLGALGVYAATYFVAFIVMIICVRTVHLTD